MQQETIARLCLGAMAEASRCLRSEQKDGLQAKLESEANEAQRLQDKWPPE